MPYLAFQNAKGEKVELSGNNLAQFQAAIEKNGTVAHPELALAFVKAFFIRRDAHVKKQKAVLAEDEDAADAVRRTGPHNIDTLMPQRDYAETADGTEACGKNTPSLTHSPSQSSAAAAAADVSVLVVCSHRLMLSWNPPRKRRRAQSRLISMPALAKALLLALPLRRLQLLHLLLPLTPTHSCKLLPPLLPSRRSMMISCKSSTTHALSTRAYSTYSCRSQHHQFMPNSIPSF